MGQIVAVSLFLGGCDEDRMSIREAIMDALPPPPPVTLKGCQQKFRLPGTTREGLSVVREVSLRVRGNKVRYDVTHVLTAADGGRHVFEDIRRRYEHRNIPRPAVPPPGPDDSQSLPGQGIKRVLSYSDLVVQPGKPLRVETKLDDKVPRGEEVEVKVQMIRKGSSRPLTLPLVFVRVDWSGCPTVR